MGSVKTNIGHLEAAAGIAGLIKVALALKHREIPPSLHFREPNPHIPFDRAPAAGADDARVRGLSESGPALAGVSSFGFGGTNAHVVLEEAPQSDPGIESAERAIVKIRSATIRNTKSAQLAAALGAQS